MEITQYSTLKEARAFLTDNYKKGVDCPCCKRFVKLYKRKLNSGMIMALIILYKNNLKTKDYVHVEELFIEAKQKNTHDWALLRFWGFIEEMPRDKSFDNKKKSSGKWRITKTGVDFVLGRIDSKKYIYLYNNKYINIIKNTQHIFIKDCLADQFDYNELMSDAV